MTKRRLSRTGNLAAVDAEAEHWDELWSTIAHTFRVEDVSYSVDLMKFRHLKDRLPPHPATLEVGCGSARLSCLLAKVGSKTTALDTSREALRVARANYRLNDVQGRFVRGAAERLPFADDSFDVVLSTGLLEHFSDPSAISREMVRILRPGGLFYSDIVPKKFSLFRLFEPWRRRFRPGPIDRLREMPFRAQDIKALLLDSGLVEITVFPAGVLPPLIPFGPARINELLAQLVHATRVFWGRFDNTAVGEKLGFYYVALARKPAIASRGP
jgi:SAM-dependent methyltransferase